MADKRQKKLPIMYIAKLPIHRRGLAILTGWLYPAGTNLFLSQSVGVQLAAIQQPFKIVWMFPVMMHFRKMFLLIVRLLLLEASLFALATMEPIWNPPSSHVQSHNADIFPSPYNSKTRAKCRPDGIPPDQPLYLCDPDGVLNSTEKAGLNSQLVSLVKTIGETDNEIGAECPLGLFLGVAIVVRPLYNQRRESVEQILIRSWNLDPLRPSKNCQRRAQLLLITDEHKLTGLTEPETPLLQAELEMVIAQQKNLLELNQFGTALTNVISGIQRIALHRARILADVQIPSPSNVPSWPILILAFIVALTIVELARLSLRPMLDNFVERKKLERKEKPRTLSDRVEEEQSTLGQTETRQLLTFEPLRTRRQQKKPQRQQNIYVDVERQTAGIHVVAVQDEQNVSNPRPPYSSPPLDPNQDAYQTIV